ncbi:MAG TPA: hypothetical protein VFQ82_14670 [Stellaceae bacterium]|nr:hypothetical protein [Stellaceae bacterium]
MTATTENTELLRRVLAYVTELYRELSAENGAPTLGTQNQVVDFILADPELRAAVAAWGSTEETEEASLEPPRRLPCDAAYRRIRDYMASVMETPVFARTPHYFP